MNPHDRKAAAIVANAFSEGRVLDVRRNGHTPLAQAASEITKATTDQVVTESAVLAAVDEITRQAQRRVDEHQRAVVLALARERFPDLDAFTFADLEDRLNGFDYPPSETYQGFREYELDGKPLVQFFAPEVAFEDPPSTAMLVNLRYRIQE